MKAVLIHVDPRDGSLKISSCQNLSLPSDALEVVSLEPAQLASVSEAVLAGRLTGTIFGLLKMLSGNSFRPPYDYAAYHARDGE
jgi:hypothetical protein